MRQLATSKRILLPLLILATCGLSFADYGDTVYFTYQIGSTIPSPQYSTITSTTTRQIPNLAIRTSGQWWIQASLSSTTTPSTLTMGVNPTGLSAGGYSGSVEVWSPNMGNTLVYYINLTVTNPPPPLTASPSSMTFNAVQGATLPPSQTLVIGALITAGAMITSDSTPPGWLNAGWISVGTAPMRIPLSISPSFTNLSPGTYTTSLHFTAPFSSQEVTVPITLNVSAPPPVLRTSANQLPFQYLAGSSTPATQAIQVTSSGSALTTAVSLSAPWLTANPLNGSTPLTVNVGVNPAGLAAGTYNGQVVVTTTGVFTNSSTQTIAVSLTVTPDNRPIITSVVNAASFKSVIGPGTWISIMGSNLGPNTLPQGVPFPISMNGVSAELDGVGGAYSLLFQFTSPTQINAFLPQVLPISFLNASCSIAVTTPTGATSFNTFCQGLAPALFSYGPQQYASATHLDGSVVGVVAGTRPAQNGEIITLWGTGFGQTAPPVSNVNSVFPPQVLANSVAVYVGGQSVQVLWAGMVGTGLYQFNIQLPDNLMPGDVPVSIKTVGTETERVVLSIR
uniref:BACON domain-containing protein n=1 Tax=Solibacter usitatus (strain Ellin6076) TaxID=234267 RepID=Q01TN4_SOLUE